MPTMCKITSNSCKRYRYAIQILIDADHPGDGHSLNNQNRRWVKYCKDMQKKACDNYINK